MPYFIDFFTAITDLSNWLTIVVVVFVLTLIVYLICSLLLEDFVLATSINNDKSKPVSADQVYYLPTASLAVTATAKVAIASDTSGHLVRAHLISLKLENSVVFEPDTHQLYLLNYKPSMFANDELRLNTNASGLLETITSTTEDTLPAVIAELSEGPRKILTDAVTRGIQRELTEQEPAEPVTVHTVEFVNKFFVSADDLLLEKISRSWIISIDGNQSKSVTVDAGFTLKKEQHITNHYVDPVAVHGVFTRPLKKVKLELNINDPQFNLQGQVFYEITVPDVTTIVNIPITRAAFVKKVQTPRFVNGLLIENYINKPSQADGFVSIPINILKAIFSIPAQLLSFRIFHIQKETELEKAKQDLAAAREQTAKLAVAHNELNATATRLQGVSDQLNQQTKELSEKVAKREPDKIQSDIIDGKILIEAIDAYDEKWKAEYGVLDISVGKKKINGFETSINALVFKPIEKLVHGQDAFMPVPPFIPFKASDGKTYDLPTDVQRTGGVIKPAFTEIPGEECDVNQPKHPGCSVSRLNNEDTGTIGLKVFKNGQAFILSCYHVLCSSELAKKIYVFDPQLPAGGNSIIISPGIKDNGTHTHAVGKVAEGRLDKFFDCAIATLDDDTLVTPRICRIDQEPGLPIAIGTEHLQPRLQVFMSGRTSKLQSAFIKSPYASTDIEYSIGKKTIKGLIATTPLAHQGDSGAVVFDEECNIIGIVVARSPSDTYILPISRILTEFKVRLKP